jgi:hypothetical protein
VSRCGDGGTDSVVHWRLRHWLEHVLDRAVGAAARRRVPSHRSDVSVPNGRLGHLDHVQRHLHHHGGVQQDRRAADGMVCGDRSQRAVGIDIEHHSVRHRCRAAIEHCRQRSGGSVGRATDREHGQSNQGLAAIGVVLDGGRQSDIGWKCGQLDCCRIVQAVGCFDLHRVPAIRPVLDHDRAGGVFAAGVVAQ